jgi:hypothetical protein
LDAVVPSLRREAGVEICGFHHAGEDRLAVDLLVTTLLEDDVAVPGWVRGELVALAVAYGAELAGLEEIRVVVGS